MVGLQQNLKEKFMKVLRRLYESDSNWRSRLYWQ
jgi:hypothetical protein